AVVDRDRFGAGVGQADGEVERRRASVALRLTDVVDGNARLGVVGDDSRVAVAVRDRGAAGAGEVDEEGVAGLEFGVGVDVDGDRLAGRAGREGRRAAGGDVGVVGGGGGAVGSGVVDRDRLGAGVGEADGEGEGRGAAVALVGADVVDGDARL